nr:hypothetical protein [Tanacetum cinerariifolium]
MTQKEAVDESVELQKDEAYKSKYFVHLRADKMYYDLRDRYWRLGMKKVIAEYIKDRLKDARDRQKSYADKRRKPLEFSVDLPEELNDVHDTFPVSNLKKCLADPTLQVPLDEIRVDDNLKFMKEHVEILEREFKKLKRSKIGIVKGYAYPSICRIAWIGLVRLPSICVVIGADGYACLVDDNVGEEEAIRNNIKVVNNNNEEDESIEVDNVINIKESKNHPLDQVIGNLNPRTLRSQAQDHSNFFCFISTIEPKDVNEDSEFKLIANSDAGHAGCNDDCKSTSGGIQFLGDKLVVFHMAQQIIPAAQLVPKFQGIERCNNYVVLQSIPCSSECKIVRQILLDHPLSYALTATTDVLAIYLQ